MWLSDVSVKRPVFATVIALMLLAFGALAFNVLEVREYPDISVPIISVNIGYPGASAEVVESRITQIVESEVSGIEGAKSINARSVDGMAMISVEFNLERNIDEAANDVRDRVGRVAWRLPDDIDLPVVAKQDADALPILYLNFIGPNMSLMALTDYAERYVRPRLAVVPGVSQINMNGLGRPAMRIWLDRVALAARNLTVTEIEDALRRENIELPAGRVESRDREFQVRVARNFQTADQFRQLVIGRGRDGHIMRLGEVADVEVAPRDTRTVFRTNFTDTVAFGVIKQSTANTVEVINGINEEIERINADLPEGMVVTKNADDSVFIREAIKSVYLTISITTVLVGLVIFAFLGSFRAMLIPVTTIPICLTAAFIVLAVFGYTINLVTLLALVLSIGLVVDDSIVVLENVHRRIEGGEAPLLAAFNGTRQVAFAVIATTAVVIAVFAPIAFLQDNIGRIFFRARHHCLCGGDFLERSGLVTGTDDVLQIAASCRPGKSWHTDAGPWIRPARVRLRACSDGQPQGTGADHRHRAGHCGKRLCALSTDAGGVRTAGGPGHIFRDHARCRRDHAEPHERADRKARGSADAVGRVRRYPACAA